jgi:fibronectin-binding autotransporter adhesin
LSVTNSLSGSRNLVVSGNVNLNGASNHTGTTTITAANLRVASSTNLANNSITIGAGGALVANGAYGGPQAWLGSSKIVTSSTGALAIGGNVTSGGTINMGSFSGLYLGSTGNNYIDSTIGITPYSTDHKYRLGGGGGTLEVRSALSGTNYALATNGNVTLTAADSYTGATTVGSGTLRLSGAGAITNSSGITLNAGGTLLQDSSATLNRSITFNGGTFGGTGRYTGNLTVGNGHLVPGDGGIGTLTVDGNMIMSSSSVFDFDFSGTTASSCDTIRFFDTAHSLTLDGTINISAPSTPPGGNYWITTGLGSLGSITDNGLDFGNVPVGHSWTVHTGQYTDNTWGVYVTATPEPGTLVLITTALIGALAYAWRRRKLALSSAA